MIRILSLLLVLTVALTAMTACDGPVAAGAPSDSPTDAFKRLYKAVKAKNTDAIKAEMTSKTVDFGKMVSERQNTPIEKVYENGFTATTFATSLPQIRDQRIADEMGAIEVWNSKDNRWEDLPFIKEDGAWKLAVGDLFAATYKSPGPGRDSIEKQAANANGQGMVPMPVPNTNANTMVPANVNPKNLPPPTNAAGSKQAPIKR